MNRMKKLFLVVFLGVFFETSAQLTKGSWLFEGTISPIKINISERFDAPAAFYDRRIIDPIKFSYFIAERFSIGLLTRLDSETIAVDNSTIINISPNVNYFFIDKKVFDLSLEGALGYSLWKGSLKSGFPSLDLPFMSSGYNYSLSVNNYIHIKPNFGFKTSVSYMNNYLKTPPNQKGTTFIGSGNIKTSDILFNVGLFYKSIKIKALRPANPC
jgi:hypothetical protein